MVEVRAHTVFDSNKAYAFMRNQLDAALQNQVMEPEQQNKLKLFFDINLVRYMSEASANKDYFMVDMIKDYISKVHSNMSLTPEFKTAAETIFREFLRNVASPSGTPRPARSSSVSSTDSVSTKSSEHSFGFFSRSADGGSSYVRPSPFSDDV